MFIAARHVKTSPWKNEKLLEGHVFQPSILRIASMIQIMPHADVSIAPSPPVGFGVGRRF